MSCTPINGLASIVHSFDLFLIDQFGVLHDGVQPYQHAISALEQLKEHNKQVVIVSNSGKRAEVNVNRLVRMGFHRELFDAVVTSGEVAYHSMKTLLQQSSVSSCYLIARDGDVSSIAGLDLNVSEDAGSADLILISASEAERFSEADYRDKLRPAAEKNTLCLCTNPDKKMLTPKGLMFGAGRIAEIYEALGGHVTWVGKPFPAVYQHILSLYSNQGRGRILCIGDSVEHDIAGGVGVGVKTLLVQTGIQAGLSEPELQSQYLQYSVSPDYVAPALRF